VKSDREIGGKKDKIKKRKEKKRKRKKKDTCLRINLRLL